MKISNKILLFLFSYYRKNNDSWSSTFQSKAILTLIVSLNLINVYLLLTEVLKIFPYRSLASPERLVYLIYLAPIYFLINISTYKSKELEMLQEKFNEKKEGKVYFFILLGLSLAIFVFLVLNYRT